MKKKIIKIGNSAGIMLPKNIREEAGLKLGDAVGIEYNAQSKSVVVTPIDKEKKTGGVSTKFMKMVDEFMTEHEDVLKKLADK